MTLQLLLLAHGITALGLLLYGLNCHYLAHVFRRHRDTARRREREVAERSLPQAELPTVLVQLPVFNERLVVERLLHAVGVLDYPRSRLHVQVLDDSDDDTVTRVSSVCSELAHTGLSIEHVRRETRTGFKAGALAEGLRRHDAELIAILDADFVPASDWLRRCVPHFADPRVGFVQSRWGHLDREHSWLTRLQGLAIDGHFMIEQSARAWGGLLLNFNGTAGVWRRAAIEDAGGWTADTLTEDLDLSYRAQLAGWRGEFLLDTVVPAEVPTQMRAFKSQQRRWAQGSIQTALKLGRRLLGAPLSLRDKLQAALHLTHYLVHPLMMLHALLALPVVFALRQTDARLPVQLYILCLAAGTLGPALMYVQAQRALGPGAARRLRALPSLMFVGCGLAASNTGAVLAALSGRRTPFVRTPKLSVEDGVRTRSERGYRPPRDPVVGLELLLAAWTGTALWLAASDGHWGALPFLALHAGGLSLVALCSLLEARREGRATHDAPADDSDAAKPASELAA